VIIKYHRTFDKHFERLPKKLQQKVGDVVEIFQKNTFAVSLHNHPLNGNMDGRRAISVTVDFRIVFEEHDRYTLVLLLDVGNHDQVY